MARSTVRWTRRSYGCRTTDPLNAHYLRYMGARSVDVRTKSRRKPSVGPLMFDIAVAALLTTLAIIDAVADEVLAGEREPDAMAFGLIVVAGLSLVWRRRKPLVVLAVVGVAMITFWLRDHGAFLAVLGLPSLYAVAVHEEDRRWAWIGMVTASVSMMVAASFTVLNPPDGYLFPNAITMAAYLAATAAIGIVVRNRSRIFIDTQRRAERAEAERRIAAERAVIAERARIAREMHDVVAHGMSVVAIQASAAQEVVYQDPERAHAVLEQIEETSRASLSDLRRMLGALRAVGDPQAASLEPQPGLADLAVVVSETRAAGIDVAFVIVGDQRRLAAGIELAAYRIIQESLTNVRKHAGPPAVAEVTIEFGPHSLGIRVADDGSGDHRSAIEVAGGNGLVGIRERAEIYGGTFSAGPTPDGGWEVRVSLPIAEADEQHAGDTHPQLEEGVH